VIIMKNLREKVGIFNHGHENVLITEGLRTSNYGNMVMGIMARVVIMFLLLVGNTFFIRWVDFLETKGLVRSSSKKKDGNKITHGQKKMMYVF